MKTLLNVIGILAFLAGSIAFAGAQSAVHEILAGIGWLTSICALGFARLIDLAEDQQKRTTTFRELQQAHWAALLARLDAPPPMPALPGLERYFVAISAEITGPHTKHALRELRDRKMIGSETFCLVERGTQWVFLRQIDL